MDAVVEATVAIVPKAKRSQAKRKQSPEMREGIVELAVPTTKAKAKTKRSKSDGMLGTTYTLQSVLDNWSEATDYSLSIRAMTEKEQEAEIVLLNKGAAKGMKGIIKSKLLIQHYKKLVAERLKEHIVSCRVVPTDMFHSAPKHINLVTANINFLSVGEWVEVDADRTPGYNSEGGIAVIISVHDALADVK